MNDEELWSRYAAAALQGLRAGEQHGMGWGYEKGAVVKFARDDADAMLAAHKARWPQKEKERTWGDEWKCNCHNCMAQRSHHEIK